MLCSRCGHYDEAAGAFCRRCGVRLPDLADATSRKKADERLNVMVTFNALSAVFALTSAIVLAATYFGRPEAKWSIFVVFAFALVICVHQSISFAFGLELRLRLRRERARESGVSGDVAARELAPHDTSRIVDLPYVTENTTDLLPREARRAPTTGELGPPRSRGERS